MNSTNENALMRITVTQVPRGCPLVINEVSLSNCLVLCKTCRYIFTAAINVKTECGENFYILLPQFLILPVTRQQSSTLVSMAVEHQTKLLMGTQPIHTMQSIVPTPIGIRRSLRPGGGLTWATHID